MARNNKKTTSEQTSANLSSKPQGQTTFSDVPALMLAGAVDAWGATALRFSSGWETVSNLSPPPSILPQSELDAVWSLGYLNGAGNLDCCIYPETIPGN